MPQEYSRHDINGLAQECGNSNALTHCGLATPYGNKDYVGFEKSPGLMSEYSNV